ncbi:MAG: DegT/DnrJ/EryC1/StrS family aminotransferase [Pseudomonadota bacterium]
MSKPSPIPMLDLQAQYAPIMGEVRAAMDRVLSTHRYIGGPEVEGLERELAEYCGVPHAVGVSSGTDALVVSLLALGVQAGDEVIVPTFTFFATAGSVWRRGARCVFVDIDPATFNLDVAKVAEAITPRTKAIIPVHLFGQCVDMTALQQVIGDRPIAVLEDCAQAIGAEHQGRRAGSMGQMGAFSFFPSKNLGGIADGGLVTTADATLAGTVRMLRNHGEGAHYVHQIVGGNFRLDAINAAVLRAKLPHLDSWTAARQHNAARYRKLIQDAGLLDQGVVLPLEQPGGRHIYNQFVIRVPRRDAVMAALKARDMGCAVYYPVPLHLQECFASLGYKPGDLPVAEQAAAEVLALPIYGELNDAQASALVEAMASVLT